MAESVCTPRLIPLDDLITDVPGDYGMVLTYALFRGFVDLGARMTETCLVPLNADFILSDGSLRQLGRLMREGKRVIHAPSFRVVLETVRPRLEALADVKSSTLTLPPREMVKLALANKHPTVKARTINQRLCHLTWMDQFYWYVDNNTMIGYQSPAALVAIRPERVVAEPVGFWDYAFIPEAAPSVEPYFIDNSDDFFMIELENRRTGQEMVRLGPAPLKEIARTESLRATKEHRHSATKVLKMHVGDLSVDIDGIIEEFAAT